MIDSKKVHCRLQLPESSRSSKTESSKVPEEVPSRDAVLESVVVEAAPTAEAKARLVFIEQSVKINAKVRQNEVLKKDCRGGSQTSITVS